MHLRRSSARPPAFDFLPETFTAVVGPSGLSNVALILPTLVALAERGHKVGVVEPGGEGNTDGLGNSFDFAAARGPKNLKWLSELLRSSSKSKQREWAQTLAAASPHVVFGSVYRLEAEWLADLEPDNPDLTSVLLVPDLQENFPLRDWTPNLRVDPSVSFFELMPSQLVGLKRLSRQGKIAVVGGHCAGHADLDSWRVLSAIADRTIVVRELGECRGGRSPVELLYHSAESAAGSPESIHETIIDLRFSQWRAASQFGSMAA